MKLFRYIFYWLFCHVRNVKNEADDERADRSAYLIMILHFINIASLWSLANHYLFHSIPGRESVIVMTLIVASVVIIIDRRLYGKRWKEIVIEFDSMSKAMKSRWFLYFWLYVLITIVCMIITASYFTPMVNR
jgi:hypothetical protein